MKRIVKFFCMFLSSIMLLNASEKIVEADSKTEQITMTVGEKKKIKIRKNNKIKLSKKGIIQINKKGKIIAKKTGKVKVIITQNKKVKKYKLCMYDIEDEELYNLNIGADGIQEHNGTAYFATEKMNMDIFAEYIWYNKRKYEKMVGS